MSQNLIQFEKKVHETVEKYGSDYIGAIVHLCEQEGFEIEAAAKIINSNQKLKALIQSEAESLNFLPKRSKLPL